MHGKQAAEKFTDIWQTSNKIVNRTKTLVDVWKLQSLKSSAFENIPMMYPLVPKQFHNVPTIIRTLSSSHQGSYSANDELLGKHTSFHRVTEAFIHQPCPWSSRHQWGNHCMSTEKTDACCCLHVTTCPLIEMTDLSNFTPGYILKKNTISKRYMHPNVHSSIIYNNQDMELT